MSAKLAGNFFSLCDCAGVRLRRRRGDSGGGGGGGGARKGGGRGTLSRGKSEAR